MYIHQACTVLKNDLHDTLSPCTMYMYCTCDIHTHTSSCTVLTTDLHVTLTSLQILHSVHVHVIYECIHLSDAKDKPDQSAVGVVNNSSSDPSLQRRKAAVMIQSLWRGFCCRRRRLLIKHKAAVTIQSAW